MIDKLNCIAFKTKASRFLSSQVHSDIPKTSKWNAQVEKQKYLYFKTKYTK